MPSKNLDIFGILSVLVAHEVEFAIVGGDCAVLHGAPVTTFDLDIVHARSPENLARLTKALEELDAIYRHQFGRRIHPDASHLAGPGHQLLSTNMGQLDVLGTIGENEGYTELLEHMVEFEVRGMTLKVLDLPKLIEVKTAANRDKDRMVLPTLHQTLAEKLRKPT